MKKIGFFLTTMMVMMLFSCSIVAKTDVPYPNTDPRIRQKENKVTVAILNLDNAVYTLKVFSSQNRLIHREILKKKTLSGKIIDFKNSSRGWYRIVVSSRDGTCIDQKFWLGSI
ncbi:MAG: hypothetical protein AAF348_04355 [Bacteroidota bacterium]